MSVRILSGDELADAHNAQWLDWLENEQSTNDPAGGEPEPADDFAPVFALIGTPPDPHDEIDALMRQAGGTMDPAPCWFAERDEAWDRKHTDAEDRAHMREGW